jgi:D-alanyl-D-alanine carboxypeptidase
MVWRGLRRGQAGLGAVDNRSREQLQQILNINSRNRAATILLRLAGSSQTLYVDRTGKSLSLSESCP